MEPEQRARGHGGSKQAGGQAERYGRGRNEHHDGAARRNGAEGTQARVAVAENIGEQ